MYPADSIDKSEWFPKIFGSDLPFKELKINNLLSELQELLEQYMATEQARSMPTAPLHLANYLLRKGQKKHINRLLTKTQGYIEKGQARSAEYFYQLKELAASQDHFHLVQHPHAYSPAIQAEMEALDQYYWLSKLKLACEMASRSQVITQTYQPGNIDLALQKFLHAEFPNRALHNYALCYNLLTIKNENDFFQLKENLHVDREIFPEPEIRRLYNYLLNFCINKVNSGRSDFYREILNIYQALLASGLALSHGFISEWTFKNIVTTAIRLKEYSWTEEFIALFEKHLPANDKENAVAYNMATLYLAKREYKKSLQSLIGVEFTDPTYFIGARLIQLKSYYELSEFEALLSLLDAFKKYISRNKKLSPFRKQANANFLQMAKKLVRLKSDLPIIRKTNWRAKAKNFEQKLKTISPIANKDWLLEQYHLFELKK